MSKIHATVPEYLLQESSRGELNRYISGKILSNETREPRNPRVTNIEIVHSHAMDVINGDHLGGEKMIEVNLEYEEDNPLPLHTFVANDDPPAHERGITHFPATYNQSKKRP